MTKADLTAQVAANTDMTKKDADKAVNAVFEALSRARANCEKGPTSGICPLEVADRAERQGITTRSHQLVATPVRHSTLLRTGQATQ